MLQYNIVSLYNYFIVLYDIFYDTLLYSIMEFNIVFYIAVFINIACRNTV